MHGKTQEELADHLGLSQGAVSKLLNYQSGRWRRLNGFC
ncbi:helix-turn-helix domain-containing protein [Ensifer sp. YR511]